MSEKLKRYGPQAVRSGIAYGVGLLIGVGLAAFLFRVITLERFADLDQGTRLLIGVIFAFVIAGLAGSVSGFVGGYSLPRPDNNRPRWGYAWRSALSKGIPLAFALYPILLVYSLIAFFNPGDPGTISVAATMLIGVVYGILASILLGLLAIGRRGFAPLVWTGAVGFGIGGILLAVGLRAFIYSIRDTGLESGQGVWGLLGFFAFGFAGGAAWGYVFARLADEGRSPMQSPRSWKLYAAVALFLILTVIFLRPVFAAVGDLLTPQSAGLAMVLDEDTEGVHWSDPTVLVDVGDVQPAIFAAGDRVAVTWGDNQTISYSQGVWDRSGNVTHWKPAVQVTSGADTAITPQVVLDENDQGYIVWVENGDLLTSVCTEGSCSEQVIVSGPTAPTCADGVANSSDPALSISDNGTILTVWQNENGVLLYRTWSAGEKSLAGTGDCVPQLVDYMGSPRLAALADGRFVLIYQSGESEESDIFVAEYSDGQWGSATKIGIGHLPSVYATSNSQIHAAWCNQDAMLSYWSEGGSEIFSDLPCLSRPDLAEDGANNMHIIWYSNEVENSIGHYFPYKIIYESIRGESGWEKPAIVSMVNQPAQPAMAESGGDLHLVWTDGEQLQYSSQIQYDCDGVELSNAGQNVFDVARLPQYRTEDAIVPYCRNQFDRLIIAPNPDPAYSDETNSTNGAFDRLAELVEAAQYEVLFSNMWYDEDSSGNSPGRVLADGIVALYKNLEAHPEQYPRGITVRILLGHPPESTRGEFAGQIWHVLNDLRDAGVPEMENEELGWRVEVANFEGTLPHSHIKSIIVDGKTVVGAGFNMSYDHFDEDHPSGLGNGRFDLGMQVTGPVAQDARRMFDDLWEGADRLHCKDFYPWLMPWQSTCIPNRAASDHVPEVMKYYLTESEARAFSMYRTEARDEADQQVIVALASAEETIDSIHVNFTSEMICDLNVIYDQVCTEDQLLPYMVAALDAAENNGAQMRVMIKGAPIDGLESGVHLALLKDALEERGISDQVEVRLFDGPMHPKATLIDDEFLIIGSQNFHYSAFGNGTGLAEYSLGVEDSEAVDDFKRLFEYHWDRADPIE
jgi:phosphatidylserine/phosphatidylglycerophosphate/cardiolipin synthase-like enzyme